MSILIKGLDMPKGCDETCPLYLAGQCCEGCDCPLVEIPTPHGRLIDGDVLKEECYKTMEKLMESTSINISAEALNLLCGFTLIDDAPTILEAEE